MLGTRALSALDLETQESEPDVARVNAYVGITQIAFLSFQTLRGRDTRREPTRKVR